MRKEAKCSQEYPYGWVLKDAGNNKTTKVTDTQKETIERANKSPVDNHQIPKFSGMVAKLEL